MLPVAGDASAPDTEVEHRSLERRGVGDRVRGLPAAREEEVGIGPPDERAEGPRREREAIRPEDRRLGVAGGAGGADALSDPGDGRDEGGALDQRGGEAAANGEVG